ncbi:hypothetical protein KMC56_gp13 [Achromobacter phage vB_AxyP_19-32_Axy12]|uniref:Uncharacterized protein n=1 Tax=Achromobacter phage vB_AxyP_19-32_Axy12 TaxID=2591043 RepID=A0A514CUH6_9CAUD|nr:hypothetical protein KMC56_gp13 [Achromobacter phage vB_AxyP_19-32_Axy12]QDH84132.1 hypothetical protein Axy12_013 [Achromobacter phage vB_AxyP_19-32_Axy12]
MKPILIINDCGEVTDDMCLHMINYPNPLGNPLRVNERWDADFIKEMYSKFILTKIRDKDEAVINELDLIASRVMDGHQVVFYQDDYEVHGQVLADFIMGTINAA